MLSVQMSPSRLIHGCLVLLLACWGGAVLCACSTWDSTGWDDDDTNPGDDDTNPGDDDDIGPGDDDDTGGPDDDDDTGGPGDDDDGVNYPPTAPEIRVEPSVAMVDEGLDCLIDVESVDSEGDNIHYSFEWLQDGVTTSFSQPTLQPAATGEGETWTCKVTPNDGHQDGSFAEDDAYVASEDDPWGYTMGLGFDASGGASGGAATVRFDYNQINDDYATICTTSFQFSATYSYGTGQGNDFWSYTDSTITWTSGGELSDECPEDWAVHSGDPLSEFEWRWYPHAFVSCDQVASDATLAATYLGIDDAGGLQATTGTFEDYCSNVGPIWQSGSGTGPIDAIWLIHGTLGSLDALGTWGYFTPASHDNVDYWFLMGLLMADYNNPNEPVTGFEGEYVGIPFWIWIYA